MYCELEVDYYSNEAIKNKFTNFQLIATTKMQLKDSWRTDWTGHCTCNNNLSYFVAWTWKCFVAWTCCCLKVYFSSASYVCLSKIEVALYLYKCDIRKTKTNKVVHNAGSQVNALLSTIWGYHPCMGSL